MFRHYGGTLGIKNARKHIGWYLISSGCSEPVMKSWRTRLCTEWEPAKVLERPRRILRIARKRWPHEQQNHHNGRCKSCSRKRAASSRGFPAVEIDSEILLLALPHPILVIAERWRDPVCQRRR